MRQLVNLFHLILVSGPAFGASRRCGSITFQTPETLCPPGTATKRQ
jgi:hypothetical protein